MLSLSGKPGKVGINNLDYNARSVRFTTKLPTDLGNGVLKELILSYRFFVGNEVRKVVLNWNKTYHIHNGLTPYSHYVMNVTVKNEIFEGVGQKIEFETLTDGKLIVMFKNLCLTYFVHCYFVHLC